MMCVVCVCKCVSSRNSVPKCRLCIYKDRKFNKALTQERLFSEFSRRRIKTIEKRHICGKPGFGEIDFGYFHYCSGKQYNESLF